MAESELISLTSLSLSLLNLRGERQSCFQTYSGRQPSLRVFLAVKLIRGKLKRLLNHSLSQLLLTLTLWEFTPAHLCMILFASLGLKRAT